MHIEKWKRTSSGELLSYFWMRSYIDVVILIGVPLLEIWGAVGYTPLLTHRMKRLAVGPMTTPEYNEWWVRRINDNIPKPIQGNNQSIEEHLRVVPSELEIIRQDFERRNAELEKKYLEANEDRHNEQLQYF
ncbi:hypothetical protein Goklo_000830 [Gossypium klotzschianum]|uniref:Uncharacterized protein n=1 Tax=Gossypium klotzschianum TaxID=34286 RepID=A0A7J8VYE2_9ROSI|nr:hypothetical protein [Gossypium klotzschianum]